jgi:hypothetical protein
MDELARLLSVERRLLDLLLFKLVEGRHLLAAGEARFLPYAAAEVERAMERVQEAELRRSILVSDLARGLEIPEEALTLSALARESLEPYGTIFSDHGLAFLELAAEIEDVTRQNRRLAERGAHDLEQLLVMVGRPAGSVHELKLDGPDHGARHTTVPSSRFRRDAVSSFSDMAESVMDLQMAQNGYQAVLGAVSRLTMPSLMDFLR